MIVSRDEITRLIPHAGTMCLLDHVLTWDTATIRCSSSRHRLRDNPLRQEGRLGALCGIEFAAQAMAIHGRLAGAIQEKPRVGYIASLREIICRGDRLDLLEGDLIIDATRLMGDDERVMYSFIVSHKDQEIVTGRATVILQVAAPS